MVDLAKFAKKKDVDANRLSGDVANFLKALPEDKKATTRAALTNYFKNPDDPQAGKLLDQNLNGLKTDQPAQAEQVKRLQKTLKRQQGAEHTANSQATANEAAKNDSYSAFNAPTPGR